MKKKKKKLKKKVEFAIAHIKSTFNNTIVTITDKDGNTLCWASGGTVGYKGTKKGTPYAAQLAAAQAAKKAQEFNVKEVFVYVKGPGSGRDAAIRALEANGLKIKLLKDVTGIPHNGCRPPKRRRV